MKRTYGAWALIAPLALTAASATAQTKRQLSASFPLTGSALTSVPSEGSLACAAGGCAAFYADPKSGCRMGAVQLSSAGAPIESTRVDLGRGSCWFTLLAAGAHYVLSYSDYGAAGAHRLLRINAQDLSSVDDLSAAAVDMDVRGVFSDGRTLLLLDWGQGDVATTIDLGSGAVLGQVAIEDFWPPVVIPGDGQYLLFYPDTGTFRRLSSENGQWLGAWGAVVAPIPTDVMSREASGYFRDGVYQLAWRNYAPSSSDKATKLFGIRVSAETGAVLDTQNSGPSPQLLCADCPALLVGAFQLGGSSYFWLARANGAHSLLELDPATGLRKHSGAPGPDVTFASPADLVQVAPAVEPKLLAVGGAIHAANTSDLGSFVGDDLHYPGRSSSSEEDRVALASNGASFVAGWSVGETSHANLIHPAPRPALNVGSTLVQELGLQKVTRLQVASAGGNYLFAGTRRNDDRSVDLVWQVMRPSGALGRVTVEPGVTRLVSGEFAQLTLGSDGERYLLALFSGSQLPLEGRVQMQRLSAEGEQLEPPVEVVKNAFNVAGVHATFSVDEPERRFAVVYRDATPPVSPFLQLLPAASGVGESVALAAYGWVLASNGHSLLTSKGVFDPARLTFTPHGVPEERLRGVSHWDGNAYVTLDSAGSTLSANQLLPETFVRDGGDSRVSEELLDSAVAVGDGAGRSLIAYFASEGPQHLRELRGVLLETASDEGGAGGEPSQGGAGGEPGPTDGGQAQVSGGAPSSPVGGDAHESGGAGDDNDVAAVEPAASRTSKGCGCALPRAPASSGYVLLAGAALALLRRRPRD